MSGGGIGGGVPLFLSKHNDALELIGSLVNRMKSSKRKSEAASAQAAVVEFCSLAKSDWEKHNNLRLSLANWIADNKTILDEANKSRAMRYGDECCEPTMEWDTFQ